VVVHVRADLGVVAATVAQELRLWGVGRATNGSSGLMVGTITARACSSARPPMPAGSRASGG
jgi:hypothetical protein